MKKLFIVPAMLFFAGTAVHAQSESVDFFHGTFEEACAQARTENKYILLDCYTQWCGPCKYMDVNVFPVKEVGDYINPLFVFLKMDMENGEGLELGKKFNVNSYPTYIVMDADGNVIHRFTGAKRADAFIAEFKGVLDKNMSPEALTARFEAGDRDKAFMHDYFAMLVSKRDPAEMDVLKIIVASLTEEEKVSPDYWFIYENYASPESEYETYLIQNRARFDATLGEQRMSDFYFKLCSDQYLSLCRGNNVAPAQEDLSRVDAKARAFGVDGMADIIFYRAAAGMRVNNTVDEFLTVFKKYDGTLTKMQLNSILLGLICTNYRMFSAQQEAELLNALDDEKMADAAQKVFSLK